MPLTREQAADRLLTRLEELTEAVRVLRDPISQPLGKVKDARESLNRAINWSGIQIGCQEESWVLAEGADDYLESQEK